MAYLQTVQLAAVDKTLIFIISEQGILNFWYYKDGRRILTGG
jgi:hypothetical protein